MEPTFKWTTQVVKDNTIDPLQFRPALLDWYIERERNLPWRQTKDPYKILVSEIMLQQTQVLTAIPYYNRWIKRFPDIKTLAYATMDEVLTLWEGMGYYNRARNLHKTARLILENHGGFVPASYKNLLNLPGIGKYTAGAVASIAFNQRVPAVDANVRRVLSRLYCRNATEEELSRLSLHLLGEGPASDFNQAFMELGALVCISGNPRCGNCPVSAFCEANSNGVQEQFPTEKKRKKVEEVRTVVGILMDHEKKIYIQKRPQEGLFAGLWEFPGGKVGPKETPEKALQRELKKEMGIRITISRREETVRHTYTRFRAELTPFLCLLNGPPFPRLKDREFQWVLSEELSRFAFPAANRKIIKRLWG